MEKNILVAIEAEEKQLALQLAILMDDYANKVAPIQKRLDALKGVRIAYGVNEIPENKPPSVPRGLGLPLPGRTNTFKSRVLDAAITALQAGPIPTRELVDVIEKSGVMFSTDKKAENLSVILSKDERFTNDRRSGWSLAEKTPQDAPTSAGSLTEVTSNLKVPD